MTESRAADSQRHLRSPCVIKSPDRGRSKVLATMGFMNSTLPARFVRVACAALTCLMLTGCAVKRKTDPGYDGYSLAANLDLAEVHREVALIDFGAPEARRHMLRGWSYDEKWNEDTFVWSYGKQSAIQFFLTAARDLPARFRCLPLSYLDRQRRRSPESFAGRAPLVLTDQCAWSIVAAVQLRDGR